MAQWFVFVADDLVTPVILGTDFLQKNALVLDFTSQPVSWYHSGKSDESSDSKVCSIGTGKDDTTVLTSRNRCLYVCL